MMDWLSSKVVLGIASLVLIASIAGVFDIVRERNLENLLNENIDDISRLLWDTGMGAT